MALVARLWFLQVMNADAYEQRAIANAERAFMAPLAEAEQERLKQALRALIEAGER